MEINPSKAAYKQRICKASIKPGLYTLYSTGNHKYYKSRIFRVVIFGAVFRLIYQGSVFNEGYFSGVNAS